MPAAGKIFGNHLNVVKSSDFTHNGERFSDYEDQYCEVIENADGVPYQLIFGPEPGEGYYRFMGEGITKLLGVKPEIMTERLFQEMIREIIPLNVYTPANIAETRKKLIEGEISSYKAEVLVQTNDGHRKWLCDSSLPIRDKESGKIIGSCGILFDVTERKQVMEYLNIARERAEECDRLKNSFLRNISHEVRTPLNAIVGFSTLLCEPEQGYHQKKEFVDIINASTDHFLEIMDNILEISRIEAGSVPLVLNEINLSHLVCRIYERFRCTVERKDIVMTCEIPENGDQDIIFTDGYKVFQVLNNLLSNAVKFTISGKISFGYLRTGDEIEFYVQDTGIGIQPEHKNLIFNKFYQAESGATRRFPGTGLGLSISKAYVEMLGGSIRFLSEEGQGSDFRFVIPVKNQ